MAKQAPTGSAADAIAGMAALSPQVQANILAEALPHMLHYDNQTIIVKYGGHAMGDPALAAAFA